MSLEFFTCKTSFEGKELNGALTEMENSVLFLLWEGMRPLLGTLTVTLPNRISSRLLGDRDALFGQILGEQLASYFQKMALVSVNLRTVKTDAAGSKILELVKEIIGERAKNRPSLK
jgi:hypothetical protein